MLNLMQRGFSLIELMVAVAILAIALSIGVPNMNQWLQNGQVRNAAESIQAGLQLARAEAVRRNTLVRFSMMSSLSSSCSATSSGDTNWVISQEDASAACHGEPSETTSPLIIQKRAASEGSPKAHFEFVAGANDISFNGTGRRPAGASEARILISNPDAGNCSSVRCLRIDVSSDGQSRVCDPSLPSSHPRGCSS